MFWPTLTLQSRLCGGGLQNHAFGSQFPPWAACGVSKSLCLCVLRASSTLGVSSAFCLHALVGHRASGVIQHHMLSYAVPGGSKIVCCLEALAPPRRRTVLPNPSVFRNQRRLFVCRLRVEHCVRACLRRSLYLCLCPCLSWRRSRFSKALRSRKALVLL